jgi:hypothetical protein
LKAFFVSYPKQVDDLLTLCGVMIPVKWECSLRAVVRLRPPTGCDWPPARDWGAYPPQMQAMLDDEPLDLDVYTIQSPLFVAETVGDIMRF